LWTVVATLLLTCPLVLQPLIVLLDVSRDYRRCRLANVPFVSALSFIGALRFVSLLIGWVVWIPMVFLIGLGLAAAGAGADAVHQLPIVWTFLFTVAALDLAGVWAPLWVPALERAKPSRIFPSR